MCNNLLNKKICESQYSLRRNHENSESKGLLIQCYPCINEEILKLLIKQPIYSRDHSVHFPNLVLKFCTHLYSSHENNCFFFVSAVSFYFCIFVRVTKTNALSRLKLTINTKYSFMFCLVQCRLTVLKSHFSALYLQIKSFLV